MLYVNCELPTEPQEHFTLWTTVTKSEPSYRTQLTGDWPRTRQRRSNAKPLFFLSGLHLHRGFAGDYVVRTQGHRGVMDFLRFIKRVSPIVSNIGAPTYKLLRHCARSRKVEGSIPNGVIGIFH